MAEIHMEEKRRGGMGWLWTLIAIILIALLAWMLWPKATIVEPAAVVDTVGTTVTETIVEPTEQATLGAILANPSGWVGKTFSGEVTVAEVPHDRGFWIEQDGQRLYAVLVDEPREVPIDINAGQRLRLTGTVRDPAYIPQLAGKALESDTQGTLKDQQAYLVVGENAIEILEPTG